MAEKKKLIRLPIELYQRESFVKLYFALKAAKQGYQCLIYDYNNKVIDSIPGGLYFYKDHANWSIKRFEEKRKKNMYLAAFDEEGLIYDEDLYSRTRGCKQLLDELDLVFLWGNKQKSTIDKITKSDENKVLTGSLKFDIYKRLRNKNKKTKSKKINILINTRFTYVNGLRDGDEISVLRNLGFVNGEAEEKKFLSFLEDDKKIFQHFDRLITLLANNSKFNIVIRPHPAENFNFYKNYERLSNSIKVNNKELLTEQILESDIVIHDGCTTAIESRALGVPCIGLRPDVGEDAYNDYANQYSENYKSADDIYHLLSDENFDLQNIQQPDVTSLATYSIFNWQEDVSAAEKMLSCINNLKIKPQKIIKKSIALNLKENIAVRKNVAILCRKSNIAYKLFKLLYKDKIDSLMTGQEIANKIYPCLNQKEILLNIKYLCDLDSSLGAVEDFNICSITRKSMLISDGN